MGTPRTEIIRGEEIDEIVLWEQALPAIESAVSLAEDGLDYLGVTAGVPKRATIHIAGDATTRGEGKGESDILLYVRQLERGGKFLIDYKDLSVSAVHELLHTIRSEYFEPPEQSYVYWRAAQEGIAYRGEQLVTQEIFTGSELRSSMVEAFVEVPDIAGQGRRWLAKSVAAVESLLEQYKDPEKKEKSQAVFWALSDDWFTYNGMGTLIGIQAVEGLLKNEVSLSEIVTMPSEEVINQGIQAYENPA